jgi:hypothetical protein
MLDQRDTIHEWDTGRERSAVDEWAPYMNGAATGERARARTVGVTRLRLVAGPLLQPVLCRVVSMVLTRADWPLDRLEEAMLVCDALCAPGSGETDGSDIGGRAWLTFSIDADEREAALRVWELTPESAKRLVHAAHLPLVGNVLEHVAERIVVETDPAEPYTRLTLALRAR